MKAVIYARFSSNRQNDASIDAQERACREYAARNGMQIVGVYADEAISGTDKATAYRSDYQRMLKDAATGAFSVILIHKYDRVARSLSEHVNLEKRLNDCRVELVAVDQDFGNTPESKIVRAVMWSLSEYYSVNLGNEARKGHRETALKGLHNGGYAPFGYDVIDQRYIINELEAGFVKKMFDAAQAQRGFTALIAEMEAAGIVGKRGRPIKYPQIYEILRNERYTGEYIYSVKMADTRTGRREKTEAIRIPGALPAIVSKEQFSEVQRIMSGRKQTGKRGDYMCSGLLYCSCGKKMHVSISRRKGHEYRYFNCSGHCGKPTLKMQDIDEAAFRYLRELLSDENQKAIAAAIRFYQSKGNNRADAFREAMDRRAKEKQREYDNLLQNLSTGALPPEIVADIGDRMQRLKAEIESIKGMEPPEDFTTDFIMDWLRSIKAAPDEKAVRLLVERIDVREENGQTVLFFTSTLSGILGDPSDDPTGTDGPGAKHPAACPGKIAILSPRPIFPAILFCFRAEL